MSVFKILLLPFAMLYDLVTDIRNRLYDQGLKPSTSFDVPVIGVGNLAAGGTGKTPMVEYLVRLLAGNRPVATLSRGYGRKTRGFRMVNVTDDASTVGDEPWQLYDKYHDRITVSVGEERALAIPLLVHELPDEPVIILDDSFQHRRVKPGFQVLLTEYGRPFYDDYVLPYGRLREGPEGASRADVIVVTKCPDNLEEEAIMNIEKEVQTYSTRPVFFSHIRYGEPAAFGNHQEPFNPRVVLVSGIANHGVLEAYVRRHFDLVKHVVYRDHHRYTVSDVQSIATWMRQQSAPVCLLTTEKDKAKLHDPRFADILRGLPIFYLPIEMEFLRNGKDFDTLVTSFIESFHRE